jgi:hypothetical protein
VSISNKKKFFQEVKIIHQSKHQANNYEPSNKLTSLHGQ